MQLLKKTSMSRGIMPAATSAQSYAEITERSRRTALGLGWPHSGRPSESTGRHWAGRNSVGPPALQRALLLGPTRDCARRTPDVSRSDAVLASWATGSGRPSSGSTTGRRHPHAMIGRRLHGWLRTPRTPCSASPPPAGHRRPTR